MHATIAAIATGPASGGIGVIRISGPAALIAAAQVCTRDLSTLVPRFASRARFAIDGRVVDDGLVLFFQGPHSYTGEDVVELHAHGSVALLRLLLSSITSVEGVRLAEAGEFTRRAYLSGQLDLARAEAVADLVAAESAAQVYAAAAQLSGELSTRLKLLGSSLLDLRADIEGVLDFPDEAEGADAEVGRRVTAARTQLAVLLADGHRGALVRRGAKVVLYGPVNAGKSTLFNRLVGAERAIVDAEPGTTRDALEATLEVQGLRLTLVDTAGLRDQPGRLEALGIERSRQALVAADLAVLVVSPEVDDALVERWRAEVPDDRRVEVRSKADLVPGSDDSVAVSGLTGRGVEQLRARLLERLGVTDAAQAALVTSERHLDCLRRASEALTRASAAVEYSTLEVVGGEVGQALTALAEITGVDASTELLDAIFARFCIGK
jgi:tRNA modification GTPase